MNNNTFYIYNNEAITICMIIALLKKEDLDISRLFITIPLLVDKRLVKYIIEKDNICLESLLEEKVIWFSNFNQRYLELSPVILNSLVILYKERQITIQNTLISQNNKSLPDLNAINVGERLSDIQKSLPKLISMLDKYNTKKLYKLLNIML